MFLKLIISVSLLTIPRGQVAATPLTGCHELQLSQLKSLNERMSQMIDTISTLLPKSLKKLTSSVPTPVPSVDHVQGSTVYDPSYFISPPAYSSPPPVQHIMYIPTYAALPTDVPLNSNPISTPHHYITAETAPQSEYPISAIPSSPPQSPKTSYQYEQTPQYISPIATHHLTSTPYPYPGPYSVVQSPYPPEYTHSYPFSYPLPAPTHSNIPAYTAGLPFIPVPVHIPPGAYIPTYPQASEIP